MPASYPGTFAVHYFIGSLGLVTTIASFASRPFAAVVDRIAVAAAMTDPLIIDFTF